MKTWILLIALLGGVSGAAAQVAVQQEGAPSKTILVGQRLVPQEVVRIFGEPRHIEIYEDEEVRGPMTVYDYDGLGFSCIGDEVCDFALTSEAYVVELYGKYKVRVGDDLVLFRSSIPADEVRTSVYNGVMALRFRLPGSEDFSEAALVAVTDGDGKIRQLMWAPEE